MWGGWFVSVLGVERPINRTGSHRDERRMDMPWEVKFQDFNVSSPAQGHLRTKLD